MDPVLLFALGVCTGALLVTGGALLAWWGDAVVRRVLEVPPSARAHLPADAADAAGLAWPRAR